MRILFYYTWANLHNAKEAKKVGNLKVPSAVNYKNMDATVPVR
jgi:hypothetical protein